MDLSGCWMSHQSSRSSLLPTLRGETAICRDLHTPSPVHVTNRNYRYIWIDNITENAAADRRSLAMVSGVTAEVPDRFPMGFVSVPL